MYQEDIINVLKNSKKYSKSNFVYNSYDILYTIGNNVYKIQYYGNSGKVSFYYDSNYSLNISEIKISIIKETLTENKVLAAFGKIVRILNKLDLILLQESEILKKITPVIKTYFKKEYDIETDFDNDINPIRCKLPNSTKKVRRRYKNTPFDVSTEDSSKIIYDITASAKEANFSCTLYMKYLIIDNSLIITRRDINYKRKTKDVTKIIRGEKLKRLMFAND